MTEQQLEILEKTFRDGGMICFWLPNGVARVAAFGGTGAKRLVMERLVDELAEPGNPDSLICRLIREMAKEHEGE